MTVTDNNGQAIVMDGSKLTNQMARDFVIDSKKHSISTSSFAVIHQISTPLCSHKDTNRYDTTWTGSGARERLKAYRQQFDTYLYKRYDREN